MWGLGFRVRWHLGLKKGKKEENVINNSLKDINRYFKVATEQERTSIEASIAEGIKIVSNFSLLQNAFRKNINNNKSESYNKGKDENNDVNIIYNPFIINN